MTFREDQVRRFKWKYQENSEFGLILSKNKSGISKTIDLNHLRSRLTSNFCFARTDSFPLRTAVPTVFKAGSSPLFSRNDFQDGSNHFSLFGGMSSCVDLVENPVDLL